MNRREAGATLLFGAAAIGAPVAAMAQGRPPMPPLGPIERRHVMDTARTGSLALQTSQMALQRARNPMVRQFAEFEVAEQTTVAEILRDVSGMAPPPPDPEARRVLMMLRDAPPGRFEAAYVTAQLDGHRTLLAVQERYLREGRNRDMRHVAMLARGQIREHLALL